MVLKKAAVFVWILVLIAIVSGKAHGFRSNKRLENLETRSGPGAESGRLLSKLLEKKILKDLKQLNAEEENTNLAGADDRKRQETPGGKRAQLALELMAWLNEKDDKSKRGWGNGQLPWKY